MRTNNAILLSSFVATGHAWSYYQGASAGFPNDNPEQSQIFESGSASPNITASAPVALPGGHNFTLRVNVTDLALPGVDTSVSDPRAVVTAYDVTWEGSFNETFENPGPSCFSTTSDMFSGSVTSKASADGDCTDAFGEDCVNALKGYSPDCDSSFFIPSQCQDAFKGVENIFGFEMSYKNMTEPLDIFSFDSTIMSPSDSEDEYNSAAQQMYFALFRTGQRPAVPVCIRPSSGAGLLAGSMVWTVATAAAAALWIVA